MAHVGQERTLGPVGGLGGESRLLQFGRALFDALLEAGVDRLDLPLGGLAFGDVDAEDRDPFGRWYHMDLEPAARAVREDEFVFAVLGNTLAHAAADPGEHVGRLDAGIGLHQGAPEQGFQRLPVVPHAGRIDVPVPPVEADDLHALEHVIQGVPVKRRAVAQGLFGLLAIGDVEEGAQQFIADRDAGNQHQAHGAVLAGHPVLDRLHVAAGGECPADRPLAGLAHPAAIGGIGIRQAPPVVHRLQVGQRVAEDLDEARVDIHKGIAIAQQRHWQRGLLEQPPEALFAVAQRGFGVGAPLGFGLKMLLHCHDFSEPMDLLRLAAAGQRCHRARQTAGRQGAAQHPRQGGPQQRQHQGDRRADPGRTVQFGRDPQHHRPGGHGRLGRKLTVGLRARTARSNHRAAGRDGGAVAANQRQAPASRQRQTVQLLLELARLDRGQQQLGRRIAAAHRYDDRHQRLSRNRSGNQVADRRLAGGHRGGNRRRAAGPRQHRQGLAERHPGVEAHPSVGASQDHVAAEAVQEGDRLLVGLPPAGRIVQQRRSREHAQATDPRGQVAIDRIDQAADHRRCRALMIGLHFQHPVDRQIRRQDHQRTGADPDQPRKKTVQRVRLARDGPIGCQVGGHVCGRFA